MNEFVLSAYEDLQPVYDEMAGASIERGIWKAFDPLGNGGIKYNQLEVDPYSCTLVATFGCLSNMANKVVPYSVMKEALADMLKNGKFTPNKGAKLIDGVEFATKHFNAFTGQNWKSYQIAMNLPNAINAMKSKSGIVTGMTVQPNYFNVEQETGLVKDPAKGKVGHSVWIGKINTMDDYWYKYLESYEGRQTKYGKFKSVIQIEEDDFEAISFNTGFAFTI